MWAVFIFFEPFDQMPNMATMSTLATFQQRIFLQHLFAAYLANNSCLCTSLPLSYSLLCHAHTFKEASCPTPSSFFLTGTPALHAPFAILKTFQLSLLSSQLKSLSELHKIPAQTRKLQSQTSHSLQIELLIQILAANELYALIPSPAYRRHSIIEYIIQPGENCQFLLKLTTEFPSSPLSQQFGCKIQPIRKPDVQFQQKPHVIVLRRHATPFLVKGIAEQFESKLQIAILHCWPVCSGKTHQIVKISPKDLHLSRQATYLMKAGTCILLKHIHERPISPYAIRGKLHCYHLECGPPHKMFSKLSILLNQQTANCFEAIQDILQRSRISRFRARGHSLQCLAPSAIQQIVYQMSCPLLRRRLFAEVVLTTQPIIQVISASGFAVDRVPPASASTARLLLRTILRLESSYALLVYLLIRVESLQS